MMKFVLIFILGAALCGAQEEDFYYGIFPNNFMWGLATSSYQIEGAWDADGKGESIWDFWSHENNGSNIADGKNGDVACDSYNNYMEDVKLLKNMGANFYRFSLSWPRIVPTGRVNEGINEAGIEYYNKLIDALIAEGITPFITLYHWDLPQDLMKDGGWLNETIVDHFADFSHLVFRSFGDRVKYWLSFNEPHVFCLADWNYGEHDPFNRDEPEKPYICTHNVVKSHAKMFRIYDGEFRPFQGGQVGITLNCDWSEPKDQSDPEHMAAMDRSMHFRYGWWANPLLRGEYPPIMREILDAKSIEEGRNSSRLPSFDAAWTTFINGTLDFLGLNHYGSFYVLPDVNGTSNWMDGDANVRGEGNDAWNKSGIGWNVVPWGLRNVTTWIAREYDMPIYITENGYGAQESEGLDDFERLWYYRAYINELLKSIRLDGSDVRAYTAWSLMDNYEWNQGYNARFGVNWVDFNDPERLRTPKASAIELTKIFADNGFPIPSWAA